MLNRVVEFDALVTIEWRKWNILMLSICLLIAWNYTVPLAVLHPVSTRLVPWALYGLDSIDFNVYYRAAQVWLSRGNPYANLSQLSFEYPPLSLPFFALFTYFGFQLASQLWVLAYFSMFAVALLALGFALKKDKRPAFVTIAALLLITSYPFLIMYQLGPIDLFLASLTVLSFVAERLRHRSLSAVILSIAALLKGTPVFLLIYFVVFRRDLRYLAWFLLSTIGIVGISLIIIPVQLYWYWVADLLPRLYVEYSLESSQSLVRLFYLAGFSKPALEGISIAGFGLFAIFAFYVNSNRWTDAFGEKTFRADVMFLMNGLIMLLLSPRSTVYPYVWVILPLALFLINLLMDHVKIQYFTWVCLTAVLMNSALSPNFLYYRTLPLALIGNLMLTMSLILIYVHPTTIFRIVRR
jgi:hypothetical protein